MKLKTLIIVTGVVVALILLTGTFSAGFVAGRVVVSADANPLIFLPEIIGISEQTMHRTQSLALEPPRN